MYLKRLKDLREDNDFTQQDIANVLKIKQQQYVYMKQEKEICLLSLLLF